MTINDRQGQLSKKIEELSAPNITKVERQSILIEVGFLAAVIDEAVGGRPEEREIKAWVDNAVSIAEKNVSNIDVKDKLDATLICRVREIVKKHKI